MNKRLFGLLTAGTMFGAVATTAVAQNPPQPGQPGQGGFGRRQRGGGFGGPGGQFGPGGGQFGARFGGQDHNPLVSHEMELINRPEVQSEIHLDLRQKAALTQFQTQMQETMRQQMQQLFQNGPGGFGRRGGQPGQPGGQGGDPAAAQADRQTQMQQFREKMQAQRAEMQAKTVAGLKEVLRPDQAQRLHELDLQWRGALSIADVKVADEVKVSAEHRTAINNLVNDYQAKMRDNMQQMFQQFRQNQQQGGNFNPQNMQSRFAEIGKVNEAARKEAEDKALPLLSADEKASWTTAIGKPFTFRKDVDSPRGTIARN